jgi:hypothetical protein
MAYRRHISKKFIACLAAILFAPLVGAAAALATDTLTPTSVVVTLQAGQSTTVDKKLHLDGLPASADIIVAVDTTGSMGTPIAQAKADATNICNTVQTAIPGARFAVMDFEDYFPGPGAPGDIPYRLLTPGFTPSCAVFTAAIATMTAVGNSGGDLPEAYNRAFFESYSDNLIVTTRDPLATQFLVVLGDATPHSATPFGSCLAAPPADFGRDGIGGTGDDLNTSTTIAGLQAANIKLLMIRYTTGNVSVTLGCYQSMASATGGTAVDQSSAPSIGTFIVNNAKAVPYKVSLQVSPPLCPIGFSFSPAPPYGPFTGPSDTAFTETITAPNLVGTYNCTVTAVMTPGGPSKTATEDVTVIVTPGKAFSVVVTPPSATNTVGVQHCVTATVRDVFTNPVPGVTVFFTVPTAVATGATPSSGSATTNGSGEATFCWTASLPGDDIVRAVADANGNGSPDPDEPKGAASKTWILPASTEFCEVKVTEGGWIIARNGDRANFGGNAKVLAGGALQGQEEYQDQGPAANMNVHSTKILAMTCTKDFVNATIWGEATINGSGTWIFRIDVSDMGEPGTNDTYGILLSNGYDSGQQKLQGGNVQIHKT